jgi:hypothetical protein
MRDLERKEQSSLHGANYAEKNLFPPLYSLFMKAFAQAILEYVGKPPSSFKKMVIFLHSFSEYNQTISFANLLLVELFSHTLRVYNTTLAQESCVIPHEGRAVFFLEKYMKTGHFGGISKKHAAALELRLTQYIDELDQVLHFFFSCFLFLSHTFSPSDSS